ncbi:MAG: hypothetical protein ACK5T6_08270, partial [Pirellula sp.]
HKTHLRLPLSRNELFRFVLTAFGSASPRAVASQHADDVLEIANNLRANRRYHLLPFGSANSRLLRAAAGEHSSHVASKRFRNSTHLGEGRSPPRC